MDIVWQSDGAVWLLAPKPGGSPRQPQIAAATDDVPIRYLLDIKGIGIT